MHVLRETKTQVEERYPHQVSSMQESESDSRIVLSSGSTYPLESFLRVRSNDLLTQDSPEIGRRLLVCPTTSRNSPSDQVRLERPRRPPRYPDNKEYEQRMQTYASWPHQSPPPADMCRTGFFFTGQGDLTRCYQCGIGLKDFSPEDDPLLEHVRHSENCEFLLEHIGPSAIADIKRQFAAPRGGLYRHPEFSSVESRLASFVSWPSTLAQTPLQLADAGFFYTGTEDHVRCFSCDGGLRRWDPEDDPWTEHCRWFPACPYAIATKGQEYIALVIASAEQTEEVMPEAVRPIPQQDPAIQTLINEYKTHCQEMGYSESDIETGVQELVNRGSSQPSLSEVIDVIEISRERRQEAAASANVPQKDETPAEESERLKKILTCVKCGQNRVNALLLPCAHHKLCMQCAETLSVCPICNRCISEKVRTFLV